jgi:hypothetical protein
MFGVGRKGRYGQRQECELYELSIHFTADLSDSDACITNRVDTGLRHETARRGIMIGTGTDDR